MNKTQLYLEAYTLSLLLIERLDDIGDVSQRGVKHHAAQLVKAIEQEEKGVSKTSSEVASILSKGLDNMMESLTAKLKRN